MIIPGTRTPPADKSQPVSDKYIEAVNVNRKILTNAQMVQQDLYEMCTGLKQMRDGKLYKELGYSSFEEYVEAETGFKRSQVYNYIAIIEKLPSEFVQSIGQIGMTKLTLLASLDESERAEITEKTDVESASVRKLKNEIDRLKAENDERHKDNMSLSRRVGTLQAQNADLQASNEELEDQIEELKARPPKQVIIQQSAKTPDDCVTHQAFEAACDRYQEQIDALESENLQLTRKAYAEKKELEDKNLQLNNEKTQLETKLNAVLQGEKDDNEWVRFQVCIEQLDKLLNDAADYIEDADEADTAERYRASLMRVLKPVYDEFSGGHKS